jgi:hypothetical protein
MDQAPAFALPATGGAKGSTTTGRGAAVSRMSVRGSSGALKTSVAGGLGRAGRFADAADNAGSKWINSRGRYSEVRGTWPRRYPGCATDNSQ